MGRYPQAAFATATCPHPRPDAPGLRGPVITPRKPLKFKEKADLSSEAARVYYYDYLLNTSSVTQW